MKDATADIVRDIATAGHDHAEFRCRMKTYVRVIEHTALAPDVIWRLRQRGMHFNLCPGCKRYFAHYSNRRVYHSPHCARQARRQRQGSK